MRLAALVTLAAIVLANAPASAAPVTLQSLRKLVHLSGISISPDGSKIAFIRSVGDYQHDRYVRALMIVPARGGLLHAVTLLAYDTNGEDPDVSSPQWAPSGSRLAYVANGPRRIKQVFVVDAAPGSVAQQLTHARKDVKQFAWSPNGKQIAFVTEDGPSNPVAATRHDDLWEVHDDGFLTAYEPRPAHIWLIDAAGGNARRLTAGAWSYMEALPPFVGFASDPSWSADGRAIAFTMQANADNSDSDRTRIAQVDVKTGKVTPIDSRTTYEYEPRFAPGGRGLAYLYPHGPGPVSVLDLWLANGRQNVDVTPTFDRDVLQYTWLSRNQLLLVANDGIDVGLYALTLPQGTPRRVQLGRLNPSEIDTASNGAIAMIASASDVPAEVYILDKWTSVPRQLTNLNARVAALDFGRSTEIAWKAQDGERSDGILTYPAGYQPGKKYPLVLRIHGGPEASSSTQFDELRQLFASRGYLVFEPNYRGSDNLGSAHEHAIYKDPGTGPGRDVMAGVETLEHLGIVDTSREAVTGHSYGGYMTVWMISHYQHWRCAVAGDPVVDWLQTYDLSATGNLAWTRDSLGGSPWSKDSAGLYRDGSPITYVRDIKTPTRIITGTLDEQAPLVESWTLYHALADLGVPVSLVAIPKARHFPTDPVHIEGYNRVTLEWVDRYMR